MYTSGKWKDYEIIDAGDGNKLERWGGVTLLRPDPQAVWPMAQNTLSRVLPDAVYNRSNTGGGAWTYNKSLPGEWEIAYGSLRFLVRPTGFKHTGLFPEQAYNWDRLVKLCEGARGEMNALNLFAYTGGATLALARGGANVVHVDAAKGMVAWAKDNLARSGMADRPVRFIVDDVMKFVLREQRRGHLYEGIVMDPPSYGRGPDGEMWKIEDDLYPLVRECVKLLSPNARFIFINSYTTGLAPSVLVSVLRAALEERSELLNGKCSIEADELGLPISRKAAGEGLLLPCGATGSWIRE